MASAAEGRGSTGGSTRTRRWPKLAPRRPDAAWPRMPAACSGGGGGPPVATAIRRPMAWASVRVRCSTTRQRRWCTWLRPWGLGAARTRRRRARPAGHGGRASRRGAERGRASEGERWGVGSSASSSIPRRGGRARGRGGRARGKEARQWWPRPRTRGVLEAFYRACGGRRYDRRGEPIWAASGLNQTLGQKRSLLTSDCSTFLIKEL